MTRILTISLYVLAGLLAVTVETLGRRPGSRIPTIGAICAFVMRYRAGGMPVGRFAMYGFWWWLGWHLFAR
ncbi:MAG TPA: DUF6186 family protein [Micromonosporaceae bacterium]|jgi:hypothetical protein